MGTLASSEDQDEMLHNAAFYQGLHWLLRLIMKYFSMFILPLPLIQEGLVLVTSESMCAKD